MFKNIQLFNINPEWQPDFQKVESALESGRFIVCGASQECSIGWTEPRGEANAPLIESIGGQWILKMMLESKVLPGSVVKEETGKCVDEIEKTTGRKPGKKEKKEISEDVKVALLAKAFTKKTASFVWIDPVTKRLVVESSSNSRSDEIITLLVKSFEGFAVTPVSTVQSPAASMSIWLNTQELPEGFTADRDCVLKACDESKASVRYAKHALDIEEIRAHIAAGKIPVQLAVTWDSRVSFMLIENGTLKKIEFLDVVMDEKQSTGKDSGFDTEVAIATGELGKLIPAFIEALGGEGATGQSTTSAEVSTV